MRASCCLPAILLMEIDGSISLISLFHFMEAAACFYISIWLLYLYLYSWLDTSSSSIIIIIILITTIIIDITWSLYHLVGLSNAAVIPCLHSSRSSWLETNAGACRFHCVFSFLSTRKCRRLQQLRYPSTKLSLWGIFFFFFTFPVGGRQSLSFCLERQCQMRDGAQTARGTRTHFHDFVTLKRRFDFILFPFRYEFFFSSAFPSLFVVVVSGCDPSHVWFGILPHFHVRLDRLHCLVAAFSLGCQNWKIPNLIRHWMCVCRSLPCLSPLFRRFSPHHPKKKEKPYFFPFRWNSIALDGRKLQVKVFP